jgi:hypothetical protein
VNETRRSLLQSIFAVPALAAAPGLAAVSPPTVIENAQKTRTMLVFKLTKPTSQESVRVLGAQIRAVLDEKGFSDIPAIVLPEFLDVGVLSLPHQGDEACSG